MALTVMMLAFDEIFLLFCSGQFVLCHTRELVLIASCLAVLTKYPIDFAKQAH